MPEKSEPPPYANTAQAIEYSVKATRAVVEELHALRELVSRLHEDQIRLTTVLHKVEENKLPMAWHQKYRLVTGTLVTIALTLFVVGFRFNVFEKQHELSKAEIRAEVRAAVAQFSTDITRLVEQARQDRERIAEGMLENQKRLRELSDQVSTNTRILHNLQGRIEGMPPPRPAPPDPGKTSYPDVGPPQELRKVRDR